MNYENRYDGLLNESGKFDSMALLKEQSEKLDEGNFLKGLGNKIANKVSNSGIAQKVSNVKNKFNNMRNDAKIQDDLQNICKTLCLAISADYIKSIQSNENGGDPKQAYQNAFSALQKAGFPKNWIAKPSK